MSNAPADLLYSKSHEWARLEGDEAVIGITHFAQESLGDITYVELPQAGDAVLEDAPEKCNSDPYGEGWLVRVKLSGKPEGLMDAAAYEAFCATETH